MIIKSSNTNADQVHKQDELFKLKVKLAEAEEFRSAGDTGVSLDESRARVDKIFSGDLNN